MTVCNNRLGGGAGGKLVELILSSLVGGCFEFSVSLCDDLRQVSVYHWLYDVQLLLCIL